MAFDVGITSGLSTLWNQQALFDFVIEVENQEIPVHKVIMASVSDYFRVMLSGPMLETSTNRVKLQGQSAAAVAKLIEVIYTGNASIVKDNALDILGPAVYFQIPKVIEACRKRLRNSLNVKNCLEVLSMFLKYSFDEEAEKGKKLLTTKFSAAFEHYKAESTSYEVIEVIIDCWRKSERELFGFLKHWVNVDHENRKVHLDALMSRVRFGLMTPQQLSVVARMDICLESRWQHLVEQAVQYHNLPTHQKVMEESVQMKVRAPPSPFVFSNDYIGGTNVFLSLDDNDRWRKRTYPASSFTHYAFQSLIVANNFLVALTNGDEDAEEQWCIFNPRNLTWSEMASMTQPKSMFSLAHHGEYLYALGGYTRNFNDTNEVERYSFRDNVWSVTGNMPVAVAHSSTCVFENHVYLSGGLGNELRMYRMNLNTHVWENRAAMLTPKSSHRMAVMTIGNEDVLFTFEEKSLNLEMYSPATDSWSRFQVPNHCIHGLFMRGFDRNMPVIRGNTIFLLTLLDSCLKWTLAQSGESPSEVQLRGVPVPAHWGDSDFQSVLLAVPCHVFQ